MLTTIKNVLIGLFEGIVSAREYTATRQIHRYLSQSVDHADLKLREESLRVRGYKL